MHKDVTGNLKAAGYETVNLVPRWKAEWVAGTATVPGRHVPREVLDLHLAPAEGQGLVKEGQFVALGILDDAGIRYERGGVRVFNGILIVPEISNDAKGDAEKA